MTTLQFLLLEDNFLDAEVVRVMLAEGGINCELLQVDTRTDFVMALETNRFDLILADYTLPGFDGFAALEIARALCPDVPFIFVSASLGEELAIESLKQGATDYVLKQRLERLVPCVQRALREAEAYRERQQAEEARRQSEAKYSKLFNLIDQGFCIIQMLFDHNQNPIDYRFLEINPAFEQQTGLVNVQGKLMRELAPNHEDHWFEIYGRVALTGESTHFENHAEQLHCWFDVYAFRFGEPHERKVAILFKDITERKQAEIERQQLLEREQAARKEAEYANRIKDDFLSVLSHELRTPLNPILGWSKLLQTGNFTPAKTAQALATIERNAKVQTKLIDDLLDVARILRGKLKLNLTTVNLASIIEAAIETVKTAATAKSISIHAELPILGQVAADPVRLQQIVWNLLSNGIKFTPQGGRVDIRLEQIGDQAQITVRDTGKGIHPEFLPHIFESFRQQDASITRQFGGLGLGLAIVRYLVKAHDGTITADSPGEGQGATFTVRLPLLEVEADKTSLTEKLLDSELPLRGICVLAVDDEPDARELLTAVLTAYGAEVKTAASATEALAILDSFQPDVLVSDIGMADVDGYTLIQRIRTLPPVKGGQVSAIALTAYARPEDRQRALNNDYQVHLAKPLEPQQLVQAVAALAHGQ